MGLSLDTMDNSDWRTRISASLSHYREKMLQYNRTILDREIALQNIDKGSTRKKDIVSLLDELWGSGEDMDAVQKEVHRVSDLYRHIPDGTLRVENQDLQTRMFDELELSLNEKVDDNHRPIAIPEEFKILATLTGGIIGPGFPMLQETTIVSALVPNCGLELDESPKELTESTQLLAEFGW